MRKLMVAIAMCIVAMAANAVQCEGMTKTGERCKREAAEGSKFCIGHADQAKTKDKKDAPKEPTEAKEKDDGTCWAMTEAGTRCKHKKDGASDYCKQHSPDVKPAKPFERCRAITFSGTQCTRQPVEGNRYCKQHGGK